MVRFDTEYGDHRLVGDIAMADAPPGLVFLHGAGRANRQRFDGLRAGLVKRNISSVAFDMIGHGDTGGVLKASSLRERSFQARAVIEDQGVAEPLSLAGASMSAYTAVRLTRHYHVENLILIVPAMYTREAYDVPFNDGFSEIIRQEGSWRDSDAWSLLESYEGNLLLITAEQDEVIPREVIGSICDAACNVGSFRHHVAGDCSHQLFAHLNRCTEELDIVTGLFCDLLGESR